MTRLALLLALTACAQVDTVDGWISSGGTVYHCADTPDGPFEYCYLDGSAAELSLWTGLECHESGLLDRWPTTFGCWYHCDDPSTPENEGAGTGCNAHLGGCYCQ